MAVLRDRSWGRTCHAPYFHASIRDPVRDTQHLPKIVYYSVTFGVYDQVVNITCNFVICQGETGNLDCNC